MKISVIVPVYNLINYIEATLDSILHQTYQEIETIIIDDGSSDGTSEFLDQFVMFHPSVKVVHQQNGGVSRARITGIRCATGEYIGFVDGDDRIDPDMYERLLANALKYQAEISHCGYRRIKDESVEWFYNTGEILIMDHADGLLYLLDGSKIEPSLCNKLFHRRLFDQILKDQMDLTIKNNEDLLMNFYLFFAADKSVYEDFCPYQYLVREGSASKQKINSQILNDPIIVARIIMQTLFQDSFLYPVAARLYVIKLIRASTYYEKQVSEEIVSVRKSAQHELKAFMLRYLFLKDEPFKRRALAFFAAYMPYFYASIHRVYLNHKE